MVPGGIPRSPMAVSYALVTKEGWKAEHEQSFLTKTVRKLDHEGLKVVVEVTDGAFNRRSKKSHKCPPCES